MTIYLYALTCIHFFKKYTCSQTNNFFKFILLCVFCYYQCIYIFKGNCAVVMNMHVQLQLCIIATHNIFNSELLYLITTMFTPLYVSYVYACVCTPH